ncbi:hypothetical protein [Halomontanus rarus]|uniref:hypothetical protein n=1 Tax=Halomontanus rarus TaxID=3034020 RepID=UPI001A99D9B0
MGDDRTRFGSIGTPISVEPAASAFAHNSGYNPTGTVGALAFRAAEGIEQYLESSELLADV